MSEENPKVIVIAEKSTMGSQGEFEHRQKTAVFDESSTLKEVLDWVRERKAEISIGFWNSAKITISEDELSNPKQRQYINFPKDEKTEEAA